MAHITEILAGESGAVIRDKILGIHDEIDVASDHYLQRSIADAVVCTAVKAFNAQLLSSASKRFTAVNSSESSADVTLLPDPGETIDHAPSLALSPGHAAVLVPVAAGWATVSEPTPHLSSQVIYVRDLADLDPYFDGVHYTIPSGMTVRILENITLADTHYFVVQAGVTLIGEAESLVKFTGHVDGDLLRPEGDLELNNLVLENIDTNGGLLSQDVPDSVICISDCRVHSAIDVVNGQRFQILRSAIGPGSITVQDAAGGLGVDTIIIDGSSSLSTTNNDTSLLKFSAHCRVSRITLTGITMTIADTVTDAYAIYIAQDAEIAFMEVKHCQFSLLSASAHALAVENPDAVGLGLLEGNSFSGAGTPFQCLPQVASSISGELIRGFGFDGKNLLGAADAPNAIIRYAGISTTEESAVATPDRESPADCDWYRGDLIMALLNEMFYRMDGFSETQKNAINLLEMSPPITAVKGLATDGTDIFFLQNGGLVSVYGPEIFAGEKMPKRTFQTAVGGVANGCTYDGLNFITSVSATGEIVVFSGVSGEEQYRFNAKSTDIAGIVSANGTYVESDYFPNNLTYIFKGPATFDQTSKTWYMTGNTSTTGAMPDSSDRGGSVFLADYASRVPLSLTRYRHYDQWVDLSDGGVAIRYGAAQQREKAVLDDDVSGEVIWQGSRKRAYELCADIGGQANVPCELEIAIVVNDEVMNDSVGFEKYGAADSAQTMRTIPVTRDLVAGDRIKVQFKLLTDPGTDPASIEYAVYFCKLSIT